MSIDLYESIDGMSKWAFGNNFLNKILGSSLAIAIVISFIMVLLIMFIYPAKQGTSFVVVLKLFVYMFFSSLLVIFLHDGILKYTIKEDVVEGGNNSFTSRIIGGSDSDPTYAMYNIKPVTPVASVEPKPSEKRKELLNNMVSNTDTVDSIKGAYESTTIKPNKNIVNPYV